MKAYCPLVRTLEPDDNTYIVSAINYYVVTQVELLELSSDAAIVSVTTSDSVTTLSIGPSTVLGRIPVYGTKTDCDSACKTLNKPVKEKAVLTIQKLSAL
jgi:hypothetical protein